MSSLKSNTSRVEETLGDIAHRLEQSPSKSLRRLSQQVEISYGFVQKVTKLLKLHPYEIKITKTHALQSDEPARRFAFCEWMTA